MSLIREILSKFATYQSKYPLAIFSFILILTFIAFLGISNIQVQSDFNKENPRQLPAYVLVDRISDEFGGENSVILVLEVDENDENSIIDLRNKDLISFLNKLETSLLEDSRVISTSSIGNILKSSDINSNQDLINILNKYPDLKSFFSSDYRITFMTITTSIGGSYEEIVPFEEMILNKIDAVGLPGGFKISLTGGPVYGKVIRETVFSDTAYTISLAAIGIFLLLLITERSLRKSLLIFIPLIFALIWTGGILGHIGLKLSIASVALGSIILGLGVEYGVFMNSRYHEERFKKKKSQLDANVESVKNIGQALLSSGSTTVGGFLALTFSITPMMQNLGLSLAIGIVMCILSALIVAPLIIIISENIEKYVLEKNLDKQIQKREFFRDN